MNIKLLKKIRKRYDWYFNSEKFPVLISHCSKKVIVMDMEYCKRVSNYSFEDIKELVKVNHTEWALRFMKNYILAEFGIKYSNIQYRQVNREFKNKQKKYKQNQITYK
jgi:hypothetical protein